MMMEIKNIEDVVNQLNRAIGVPYNPTFVGKVAFNIYQNTKLGLLPEEADDILMKIAMMDNTEEFIMPESKVRKLIEKLKALK